MIRNQTVQPCFIFNVEKLQRVTYSIERKVAKNVTTSSRNIQQSQAPECCTTHKRTD
jgi:hypothetical protein